MNFFVVFAPKNLIFWPQWPQSDLNDLKLTPICDLDDLNLTLNADFDDPNDLKMTAIFDPNDPIIIKKRERSCRNTKHSLFMVDFSVVCQPPAPMSG